jgi:hypothetical protein
MTQSRYPLEGYSAIHIDLQSLLEKSFPASELLATAGDTENLVDILLPPLCQRLCHLAAMTAGVEGGASASIMTCFSNDKEHLLQARVVSAYPVYGLDRYIYYKGGWKVHTRKVLYGSPDYLEGNEDVVSVALAESKDLLRRVAPESRTPSEENLVAVLCFVPEPIKAMALSDVEPGFIICLNIDFYTDPPVRYENYFDSYEKFQAIKGVLDRLCIMSLYRTLQISQKRPDVWDAVAKFLKKSGIVDITVSRLFQYATDYLMDRLGGKT